MSEKPEIVAEDLVFAVIGAAGVDPTRIDPDVIDSAASHARTDTELFLVPYLAAARAQVPEFDGPEPETIYAAAERLVAARALA